VSILNLYFLQLDLQTSFRGLNLQASTGVALKYDVWNDFDKVTVGGVDKYLLFMTDISTFD
jgi:hypothetical protein